MENWSLQNPLDYVVSSAELQTAPSQECDNLELFFFFFFKFPFLLSSLERWCSRSDLLLAVSRVVPAPSAEQLSWGTSASIQHMSNVPGEAAIRDRAVWEPHPSDFPLNLCVWCFTGAGSAFLPNVHFGGGTAAESLQDAECGLWHDCVIKKPQGPCTLPFSCSSRISLNPVFPITAALPHLQPVEKPHLNALGFFLPPHQK